MVAVIVPWRPGCEHRQRAWDHVRSSITEQLPDATIIEAPAPPGDWCKAAAITPAVTALPADIPIVVVHDADVICDGTPAAIRAVQDGAPWAIPHHRVHRLTRNATDRLLHGQEWDARDVEQRPYQGTPGGGIVVLARDVAHDVPLDPRFIGWGQEDESWALALHHLHQPAWRGTAPLIHLWHPPQERQDRRYGSREGIALATRYHRARRDPVAMRALIEEAKAP